jgi:hypothetical protein
MTHSTILSYPTSATSLVADFRLEYVEILKYKIEYERMFCYSTHNTMVTGVKEE